MIWPVIDRNLSPYSFKMMMQAYPLCPTSSLSPSLTSSHPSSLGLSRLKHCPYAKCKQKEEFSQNPEVGIYKRKQESKKTRKQELDQERIKKTKQKERKQELEQESE